jgi:hypothetical protein
MKKRIILYTAMLSMALFTVSSCSDDDPPPLKLNTPNTEGNRLMSVEHAGFLPSTYDWSFSYNNARLVKAYGTYKNQMDEPYTYESTLKYGHNSLKVSSTGKDKSTLTLNEAGLISRMEVNKNTYNFKYENSYLTEWTENVVSESFGQVTSYTSHADITYTLSGNLQEIVYTENLNYPYDYCRLTFSTTDTLNANGLLPEAISKEMGCLGFEHLYYAGALGRGTRNLVREITFRYPQRPEKNKTVTFQYALRGKDVVLCSYTYEGQPASATYKY